MLIWIQLTMSDLEYVLTEVSRSLGVGISVRNLSADTGYTFAVRISELPRSTSFEIRVRQGILSWTLDLFLNNFPAEMLTTFKYSFQTKKDEIIGIYESALARVDNLSFTIDDVDIKNYEQAQWNQIALNLRIKVKDSPYRLIKLKTALTIVLSLFHLL